ncbi:PE-PPE domain-containing protein [Mycolicibacterium moriokaense]|nr:PE-PPE domain-containing protein [Mycolicibacterium moriokaense]
MRNSSRSRARSILVAVLTALAALIVGVMSSITSVVTASIGLAAFNAIIVPGTGTQHPQNVPNYLENAVNYYVVPGGDCVLDAPMGACPATTYGVNYYANFWPIPLPGWGGLQGQKWNVSVANGVENLEIAYLNIPGGDTVTIFGYSQGATVANKFKAAHPQDSSNLGPDEPLTNYFFIGDPQRPSGGFFERFGFLGNVPILDAQFGEPSPTDTCDGGDRICATDFALMYDGVADFPQWLLNPVAVLNAVAGFQYIHGTYLAPDADDPATETPYGYTPEEVQGYITAAQADCTAKNYCQHVDGSDTIYITLPARYLPIYQPFIDLGDATGTSALIVPIVDFASPFTQTIIETAYDRTDYSKPQQGTLLPPATFNPVQTGVDLVKDIPVAIDMALTPGRTPLPGSPPLPDTASTLSDSSTNTSTNEDVATTTKLLDGKPLTRLGLIAKPNEGISATGTDGSSTTGPVGTALKDFHPVRDTVKAVSGAVSKALGKDDDSSSQ